MIKDVTPPLSTPSLSPPFPSPHLSPSLPLLFPPLSSPLPSAPHYNYTGGVFIYYFNGASTNVAMFNDTIVTFVHSDLFGRSPSHFEAEKYRVFKRNSLPPIFDYEFKIIGPYMVELHINNTLPSFAGTYLIQYEYSQFYPWFIINVNCELFYLYKALIFITKYIFLFFCMFF